MKKSKQVTQKTQIPWVFIVMTVIVVGVVVAGRLPYFGGGDDANQTIGGPFELVDHRGQARTDRDFLGKFMLIYFGYTHCPDVCPTSLQVVTDALDLLPEDSVRQIIPVMISVDPERDTPERLAEYVTYFHPQLVGLTGSNEQVAAAVQTFGIYAQKQGDGMDYDMDHTSLLFLIDPTGKNVARLMPTVGGDKMAERLQEFVSVNKAANTAQKGD